MGNVQKNLQASCFSICFLRKSENPHFPGKIVEDEAGPRPTHGVLPCMAGFGDFTYHKDDQKRRDSEYAGLISVGDVGYMTEDGFLFLCDRKKDMVISGGVNIYPAEIEATLHNLAGVQDCAVFGIPDDEYGEKLCAVIELESGANLSADNVRAFAREHLAGYMVPKVVEFQTGLPREDSGKIFKRRLREPYWRGESRKI